MNIYKKIFFKFLDILPLLIIISIFWFFSFSKLLGVIAIIIFSLHLFFSKKIIKYKIQEYIKYIFHYLGQRNPNIPDKLFDNLYSEIESLRNKIKDSSIDIFDFYLIYFKYFIKNKDYFDSNNINSTKAFLEKSKEIFLSENIHNLQYIVNDDYNNLKDTSNYNILLNSSINNIIGHKFNFNKSIDNILKDIHNRLNREAPNQIFKLIKLMWNHPLRTLLFILIILLIIYIVLTFLNKDASKISPVFNIINNILKNIYCK